MRFFHPEYEIFLKTDDLASYKTYGDLNKLYKKIPNAVCIKCPGKKCVEADCCKSFSPPMMLVEFLNILDKIEKELSKEKKSELILKCIKSVLNGINLHPIWGNSMGQRLGGHHCQHLAFL